MAIASGASTDEVDEMRGVYAVEVYGGGNGQD
jgi:hypothetical protein